MTRLFLSLLLLLSACETAPKVERDYVLLDRILRPRGISALTWQKCAKHDFFGDCLDFAPIAIYDISKKEIRDDLNKLHFVCKINGDRYHICTENNSAGFCQQTFKRKWFLGKKERILVDFIKHDNIQKLKDGKTRCFSTKTYNFLEV